MATIIKNEMEANLLREVCRENPKEEELIENLLCLQRSKDMLIRRRGEMAEVEEQLDRYIKEQTA